MQRLTIDEDGAVAVTIGIFLVVLLGVSALTVDVGALFSERRELQNGADAAALALVQECIDEGISCGAVATNKDVIAREYSDANASDGYADADVEFDPAACRAEVTATTLDADGGALVPASLAQIIVDGYDGTTVAARAVAECGGIGEGEGIPLTFSEAAWENVEKVDKPDGAEAEWWEAWEPDESMTDSVFFHQDEDFGAGAFGWLALDEGADCHATISDLGIVDGDPGNNFLCDFENGSKKNAEAFENYILSNNPHFVPIYESYSGTGNNLKYTISGYAVMYITGWHFSGEHNQYNASCSGNERCLSGYFLDSVSVGDYKPGGGSFGIMTYALVE